jgi:hypothetical protein
MKFFLAIALVLARISLFAQHEEPATIRVKKESNLAKAILDNSELRLMVIDRFGNPKDNEIIGYKLYVKTKRETKEFPGFSNRLTPEIVNYLNKQKSAVKIFFTGITAKDDNGHVVKLPDVIDTWFPDCLNCDKKIRR